MANIDQLLEMVKQETVRQHKKFGVQNHSQEKWIVILGEEYGESCRAVYEHDEQNYIEEMIQVAAVAVSALESLHRQHRAKLRNLISDSSLTSEVHLHADN